MVEEQQVRLIIAIRQQRLNALSSKYLHRKNIQECQKISKRITFLCLATPILFMSTIQVSGDYEPFVALLNTVVGGLLLCLAIYSLVEGYDNRLKNHVKFMSENILITYEAERLMRKESLTNEMAESFFEIAKMVEKSDSEILGLVSEEERQWAFREGIKELDSSDPNPSCPMCRQNPWNFKTVKECSLNTCNLCGNIEEENNLCQAQ